jgi:pimeloyl-ACP methyl ester carboxylesterase
MEIRRPGTAESLTLVSPGTGHSSDVPQAKTMATRWPRSLRNLHTDKHGPEHWRTILEALANDAASRGQLSDEALSAIDCPILLVIGTEDQPYRVNQAQHMTAANARARLIRMDGAGHAAHAADPEQFADCVVKFLTEIEQ